jgi:hypothetical protein
MLSYMSALVHCQNWVIWGYDYILTIFFHRRLYVLQSFRILFIPAALLFCRSQTRIPERRPLERVLGTRLFFMAPISCMSRSRRSHKIMHCKVARLATTALLSRSCRQFGSGLRIAGVNAIGAHFEALRGMNMLYFYINTVVGSSRLPFEIVGLGGASLQTFHRNIIIHIPGVGGPRRVRSVLACGHL